MITGRVCKECGSDDPIAEFFAQCIAETDKAILVKLPEKDDEKIWIPKSQIDGMSEVNSKADQGNLVISHWLAHQKKLL